MHMAMVTISITYRQVSSSDRIHVLCYLWPYVRIGRFQNPKNVCDAWIGYVKHLTVIYHWLVLIVRSEYALPIRLFPLLLE